MTKEALSIFLNNNRENKRLLLIRLSRSNREKAKFFNMSEFKLTEIDSKAEKKLALLFHRKTKKQLIVSVEALDKSGTNLVTCREVKLEEAFGIAEKESAKEERKGRFTTYINAATMDPADEFDLLSQKSQQSDYWTRNMNSLESSKDKIKVKAIKKSSKDPKRGVHNDKNLKPNKM